MRVAKLNRIVFIFLVVLLALPTLVFGVFASGAQVSRSAAFQAVEPGYYIKPSASETDKPLLTVRALDISIPYGKAPPAFLYSVSGFLPGEDESAIDGLETLVFFIAENAHGNPLNRGNYAITVTGELSAEGYEFFYQNGTLTVTGLYPVEVALLIVGVCLFAVLLMAALIVVLVKKKGKGGKVFFRQPVGVATLGDPRLTSDACLGACHGSATPTENSLIKPSTTPESRIPTPDPIPPSPPPLSAIDFTQREKEIAELLLRGKSRSEIAAVLFISENTVKTHTSNIFEKSGVNSQKAFIGKYLLGESLDFHSFHPDFHPKV